MKWFEPILDAQALSLPFKHLYDRYFELATVRLSVPTTGVQSPPSTFPSAILTSAAANDPENVMPGFQCLFFSPKIKRMGVGRGDGTS